MIITCRRVVLGFERNRSTQLYIHHDKLIRRQHLLENRFQLFFLRHTEALRAVQFGEFGQVGNEDLGADDPAAVGSD